MSRQGDERNGPRRRSRRHRVRGSSDYNRDRRVRGLVVAVAALALLLAAGLVLIMHGCSAGPHLDGG